MLKEEDIVKLYRDGNYDELDKVIRECENIEDFINIFDEDQNNFLLKIILKVNEKTSARVFLKLPFLKQQYIANNTTPDEFAKVLEGIDEFIEEKDDLSEVVKLFACEEKRELLLKILLKLSKGSSAKLFLRLPIDLQKYIAENTSPIEFKQISEGILEDVLSSNIDSDILNKILIKARPHTRHERLIEIVDNLENKNFLQLKPLISQMQPIEVAKLLTEIENEKSILLFRLLPKDLASETFVELNQDTQEFIINSFNDVELTQILDELFTDDTIDLLEEMPSNVVTRILKLSSKESRESINKILKFPKDSAGSIMTPEYISLKINMTVEESLKRIREQAIDKETIYSCYVIDDKKKLLGMVSAKDLILHEPSDVIGSFMHKNIVFAHTLADKEEVSKLLSEYDLLALPIVDSENRLNGIVTIDDAIDVLEEETTEDISKMSGIVLASSKPYLETSVFKIALSRLPWLLVLLISATFTGLIINKYESTLNALSPLLFACIPMLMDSGGNAGSQSSATVIRALAVDEISPKHIFKVMLKEVRVAIMLAFILSFACFAKLQLIDCLIFGYNYTPIISLVVCIALFATIVIAKIAGSALPLIAKMINLDPAVVASPFITTIVDAISLLIYCGFATALLG